uniref:Uncharacterized protein n=1 Tax=Ascaris lumbricoides TaxID=6252 RepID=A0A0M3HQQ7_ASCLU
MSSNARAHIMRAFMIFTTLLLPFLRNLSRRIRIFSTIV